MKTIAFFNNKGGVGKTSLVYHLSWMMALLGKTVLVADLDPQENATSMFLSEDDLTKLWDENDDRTIYQLIRPLSKRIGDILPGNPLRISERLFLIPGDLSLSTFEDALSETWPKCLAGDEGAFRVTTAFSRVIKTAGESVGADIALIDVGPNLGAINRASLIASDYVVVPLSADLFAIRGLENVGPQLKEWRKEWGDRLERKPKDAELPMPAGSMIPLGYVVSRYSVFARGPVKAYQRWLNQAPNSYRKYIIDQPEDPAISVDYDPHNLALLKDYRSLMPLAQEARKPMFLLKPADGAIGGHLSAAQSCYKDFAALANKILAGAGLDPKD